MSNPNESPAPAGRDSPRLWLLAFICFIAVTLCGVIGWAVSTYL